VLIIKKTISWLLTVTLILALSPSAYAEQPSISAQAAVVMADDGRVLYNKNGNSRMLIASTTKIMTAIVAIENADLADEVEIKPEYCAVEGSSMYLQAGENYGVRELLLGLLLVSGNDAALALANHVAGSTEAFVDMMNAKAQELGMTGTSFANPHGLNASEHYSTALDMAKLMAYCMQSETFEELSSTKSCVIKGLTLVNHNRLLSSLQGCNGGKTGYTMAAGRCLVSSCERNGLQLICVTLSDPDDWNDHAKLYDWAYSQYELEDVLSNRSYSIPVVSGKESYVNLMPEDSLELYLGDGHQAKLRVEIPRFIFAPVNKGETGGQIWVIINDEIIGCYPLVYDNTVELAVEPNI
jgi:D-alanyl-D-alanine carboxypeptidase